MPKGIMLKTYQKVIEVCLLHRKNGFVFEIYEDSILDIPSLKQNSTEDLIEFFSEVSKAVKLTRSSNRGIQMLKLMKENGI